MHNENPDLTIWATDYSSTAVDVVKVSPATPARLSAALVLPGGSWQMVQVLI